MESSFLGNTRPFFQGLPSPTDRGGYEARHQNERSSNAPPSSTPATPTLPHAHSQQYQSYPAVATSSQPHIHNRSMTPATPYTATYSDPSLLNPHRHNTRPPDLSPDPHRTAKSYSHYPIGERVTAYSSAGVGAHLYNSQPSTAITSRGDTRTYSSAPSGIDSKHLYSTPSSTTIDSRPHSNLYVDPRIHMDPRYQPKHPDSRLNNPRPETIKLETRPPDPWAPYPKHQYAADPMVAYSSKNLYGYEGKPSFATISSSVQTPTNVTGSKEALYLGRRQDIIPKNVHNMYKITHDNLVNGSRDAVYPNGSQKCDNKYTSDSRYITEQYSDNRHTNSIKQQPLDFRSSEAQNSNSEHILDGRHSAEARSLTTSHSLENENRPLEDSVLDLSVKTVKQIPDSTAPDNEKATPPVALDKNSSQPDSFRRPSTSDSVTPPFRPRDASPGHVDIYRSAYPSHHSLSGTSITGVQRSTPPVAPQAAHSSHPLGSPQAQHPRATPPHHVAHTTQPRTTPPIHPRSATPNQIRTTPPTHAPSPHGINGSASPLLPGSPSPRSTSMLPPAKRPGDPIYLEQYSKYARLNNTSPIRPSVMSPPASLPSPQDKHMLMLKREFQSDPNRGLHLLAAASIKTEQDQYIAENLEKSMSLERSRDPYFGMRDTSYSRSPSVERNDIRSTSRDSSLERNISSMIKRESLSENEILLQRRDTLHGLDSRGVSVEKRSNIPVTSTDPKYLYRHSPYGPHSGWMTAPDPTTINSLPHERQKYQASQHLIQQHPTGFHHSSPSAAPVTVPSNISSSPSTYPYHVERKPQSPRSAPPPLSSPRASSHQSSYSQAAESRLPTHTLSYSHSGATQAHSVQVSHHHTTVAKMHQQAYVSSGSRISPITSTVSPSSSMSGPSQPQVYPHPYSYPEAQHYQHLQQKHDPHLHHKHPLHQEKHYHQQTSSIQHHQKQVEDRGLNYGKHNKTSVPQASPQTSSAAPGQPINHHSYPYLHQQHSDSHHPSYSTTKPHPSPHPMTSAHPDTRPSHPGASLAYASAGSVHPGTGSAQPGTSSTHPSTGAMRQVSGATHPNTGSPHSSVRAAHPGTSSAHADVRTSQPAASIPHPSTDSAHPGTGRAHPGVTAAHPGTGSAHAGTGSMHPGLTSMHPATSSVQSISGSAHHGAVSAQSGQNSSHPSAVSASTQPGAGSAHPGTGSTHPGTGSAHLVTGSAQPGESSRHPNTVSIHPDIGLVHIKSEFGYTGGSSARHSTGPGPPGSSSTDSGSSTVLLAASHHNNMVPHGHHYSQHRGSSYLAAPQRSPASSASHPSQSHQPSISQSSYASTYPYTSTGGTSDPRASTGPHMMTHSANQPSIPGQMPVRSPHSNHPRYTVASHPNPIQTSPARSYSGHPHPHRAHSVIPPGHPAAHSGVPSSYPKPHSHPQHPLHSYGHPRYTSPHAPGSTHPQAPPQSHPHTQQPPAHTPTHGPPHTTSHVPARTPPHSQHHAPPSSVHMTHPSGTVQSLQPPSHPEHLHYPSQKTGNPNPAYSSNHPLHNTHISHTSHSSPYAKLPMSSPSSRAPSSYSQPGVPYQYPRMPPSKSGQSPQYHGYPTYPHPHQQHHPHLTPYSERSTGPPSIDTDPSRIKTKGEQKAFDPRNGRQWNIGPWHSGPHSSGAPFGPYPATTNVLTSPITSTHKTPYINAYDPEKALNIKQEVLSQEELAKPGETSQSSNKSLEPGKAALAHKLQKKLNRTDSGDIHLQQKLNDEKQEIKDDKKELKEDKWDFSFDKLMDDLASNSQNCVSRKSKTLAKRYEQKIQIQHAIENDLILPAVQPIIEESDSEPEAPVKFRGKFKSIKDKAVERLILTYASHSDDSATEMIPDDDASDFEAELEREIRAERKRGKRGQDKKFKSVGSGSDKGRRGNAKNKLKHGKNKENKPNNKQDSDFSPSVSSGSDSSSSDDGGSDSEDSDLEEVLTSRGRKNKFEREEITNKKKVKGRRPKWQTDSSESEDYTPKRKGKKSKKDLSDEESYQPSKKNKRLPKVDTSDSEEEMKPKRRKRKEKLDSDYEEEFEFLSKGKKKSSPAKLNKKGRRKDDSNESESDDSSVSEDDSKTLVIGKRRLKTNKIESSIDSEEELMSKKSKSGKSRLKSEKYNTHSGNEAKHKKKSKQGKSKHSDSSSESEEYEKIENKIKLKKRNKFNKIGSDADSDAVTSKKGKKNRKYIDTESDMDTETKARIKEVSKNIDRMLGKKMESETEKEDEKIIEDDLIDENAHKEPDSVLKKIEKLKKKEQGREDVQEMKLWMEEMSHEMERQLKPFQDMSDIRHYYKKPQFGNGSDFPQGWESEVKSYKENIARIPKNLCMAVPFSASLNSISNKNNSKKSRDRDTVKDSSSNKGSSPAKNTRSNAKGIIKTSMALADGENVIVAARPEISSVMQRFFEKVLSDNALDSKIYSRKSPLSPFSSYLTRSPTGLTPSPSVAPSMLASDDSDLDSLASIRMNRPASDSVPISRKRSIANSLMKKLQQKYNNKKFNTQWLNKPRSILEASNKPQLLPTPGMPTTEKDLEEMDPSQLKLATFFRKETVINYRDNFEVVVTKNGINEFSPTLFQSRTRKKTKENEDAATITAVFGHDIPKHIVQKRKQEIQKTKKKDIKKLFNKKHDIGKRTSSPIGITSRSSTPGDSNILDDDEDDDSEIASEISQSVLRMITLVPPSSKEKKVRRKLRKFRSGFDYIRKAKKKKPDEDPTPIKRKLAVRKHVLWPEQSRDVAGEVRTWVVNKGLGETVLHKAARLQYHDVVIYCVENPMDFDINVRDNAGYTPLHEACNRGHLDIAQILCAHGAAVNAPGYGGMRPLHEAVENGHGELARLLLSFGADPALTTYAGQTVAALAEESHCKPLIEGYLADLKGTKGEMWHFSGPTGFLDLPEQGFNIFCKIPRSLFDFRRRHLMRCAQRRRRQIRNTQSNIEIKIKEEKIDDKDDKDDSVSTNKTIDKELEKGKEETKLVYIKQEVIEKDNIEESVDKEIPVKITLSDVDKNENEGIATENQSKVDVKDEKPNVISHKKEIEKEEESEDEIDFMSFTFECSQVPLPEIYHVYGKTYKYLLMKELLVYLDFKTRDELIIAAGNIETIELASERFMRLAHGCVMGSCSRSLVNSDTSVELVKLTSEVEKLLDVELVKL